MSRRIFLNFSCSFVICIPPPGFIVYWPLQNCLTDLQNYRISQNNYWGTYCNLIIWRNIQIGDQKQKLHISGGVPDSLPGIKVQKRGLITTSINREAALDSILWKRELAIIKKDQDIYTVHLNLQAQRWHLQALLNFHLASLRKGEDNLLCQGLTLLKVVEERLIPSG